MNLDEKKDYLDLYLVQQSRVKRLKKMIRDFPEEIDRYSPLIEEANNIRYKIEEEIEAVDGGRLTEILSQKYLCGNSLEITALHLNYSKRHIERLYKVAMEKFTVS